MPIIHLPDIKLNYLLLEPAIAPTEASQPTLVMVHGLATNLAFWQPLATALANTHRVLLFDLRGHGRSGMPPNGYSAKQMAADLHQLLAALGIDWMTLIGHSFGGSIILHYALQWPQRVSQLVLADSRLQAFQLQQSPRDWPQWERLQEALDYLGIHLPDDEPDAGYRLLKELAQVQVYRPELLKSAPKWMAYMYPQGAGQKTARRWLKLLETTHAWSELTARDGLTSAQLCQLSSPILAVYGEHSPTLMTGRQLPHLWPHMQLEILSKAGHFFPLSQPQRLLALLTGFLSSPPSPLPASTSSCDALSSLA